MDTGIEALVEEWRLLDDQMRCAEAARGRWNTLRTALLGLLQAEPNLFPKNVQVELNLSLSPTPRQEALESALEMEKLFEQASSVPEPPPSHPPKVQMWPLAKRILEEKGPLSLLDLHKYLVANGWRQGIDSKDRRVLYNTLTSMKGRFVKIDGKWSTKDSVFN